MSKNTSFFNSENDSNFNNDNDKYLLTDDSSDDEEYFIRFNSKTNYDNIDYIMIGSICYNSSDDNYNTHHNKGELEKVLECYHDVLIYFINGYIEQKMMNKDDIHDISRLHDINLSSHTIFRHLLH